MLQIQNCSTTTPFSKSPPPPAFRSPNTLPTVKLNFRRRLSPSPSLILPFSFYKQGALCYQIPKIAPSSCCRGSEGRTKSEQGENILCQLKFPPAELKQTADGLVGPHSRTRLRLVCHFARAAAGGIVSQIVENCVGSLVSYICSVKTL